MMPENDVEIYFDFRRWDGGHHFAEFLIDRKIKVTPIRKNK